MKRVSLEVSSERGKCQMSFKEEEVKKILTFVTLIKALKCQLGRLKMLMSNGDDSF
jgi:hypothetical protein